LTTFGTGTRDTLSSAFCIDTNGRLGIGTTSPLHELSVAKDGNVTISLANEAVTTSGSNRAFLTKEDPAGGANGGDLIIGASAGTTAGAIRFETQASSERLRITSTGALNFVGAGTAGVTQAVSFNGSAPVNSLVVDSSGRLLVGTSTSTSIGGVGATVQIQGATGRDHGLSITRAAADVTNSTPLLFLANEFNPVGNGTGLGIIGFAGHDGTDVNSVAATIRAEVDGTPGTDDMPGRLVFSTTADGASSPTERMRITSNAYVRLVAGTGGIQFNGDTAAANALDDYEEGTFTPTVAGTTTAGTATYSTQVGRYTKIGRTVTVEISLNWSGGTGAGNFTIEGLPFNPASYVPLTVGILSNLTLTANNYAFAYTNLGSTTVGIQQTPVGGGNRSPIAYDASAEIAVAGTYTV
jgi:hypothetical protein